MGNRRIPLGRAGVGHHAAGPPKRMRTSRRRSLRPYLRPRPHRNLGRRITAQSALRRVPEPGKTPATGPNRAGNGPSPPTGRASRWVERPMAPTVTTAHCSTPPSPQSTPAVSSQTSKPSTLTAAMTATASETKQPPGASTTLTAPRDANPAPPPPKHPPPSGCDGLSSGPTRGCRNMGSYTVTPTTNHSTG